MSSTHSASTGATTRRTFLKTAGTAAIALIGGASFIPPVRKALAAAPVWSTIPDQIWAVAVPVRLDLATYCTDADGDPLGFELDQPLPAGLALVGSVISGTPTAVLSVRQFVATADDHGGDTIPPAAPANLREK